MSLFRLGRRFCTAVPRRATDIMPNPDCRPTPLNMRVSYLLNSVGDLDTAAKYARLAVFTRIESEETEATCDSIISSMVRRKRHKEAYDLYDYFFNQHKLKPFYRSCNSILESRIEQGLVDEALDFHRSIKPGMASYYPTEHTYRILTEGLVNSGRLDRAEAMLKCKTGIFPDHVAFNYVIRSYLDLGDLDKANQVLSEFKKVCSGVDVSQFPYQSLRWESENRVAFVMATFMEYWFKQGKEMEAMECYNQSLFANKFPIQPDTGDAFLKVLLKYGEKEHAWDLYNEMFNGTERRCIGYCTVKIMVEECFDTGRFSEAIETYKKAIAKNRFASDSYIIEKCCENGMLAEAESLLADSVADGFRCIEQATFKTMIDAYVKAGRIDDAIKTSNKMIDATLEDLYYMF